MIYWVKKALQKKLRENPSSYIELWEPKLSQLSAERIYSLGVAYDMMGIPSRAKALWKKSLERNLAFCAPLYALSLKAFEQKDFSSAQRWFKRAMRCDQDASNSCLHFQQRLRALLNMQDSVEMAEWCLRQLQENKKGSEETQFEWAKLLFERSEFQKAAEVMKPLITQQKFCFEVTQYLSYIYERIYEGDELILATLDLAERTKDRSDLFFNLAMICQHDQKRQDLGLHFFYLACREDPQDPGLRFSLEQACIEFIGSMSKSQKSEDLFNLMVAHLYHGSVAVAERYAQLLRERYSWKHPEHFLNLQPSPLWRDWLLKDQGPLGEALELWFGSEPRSSWRIQRRIAKDQNS